MKSITNTLGIILVIIGILVLAYEGYSYTKQQTVAQIGDLKVTAETQERVYIPPVYGALSLVAGIVLVVIARRNSN